MKFPLLLLLFISALTSKAQIIPTDSITGKFKYEEVLQTDSISQEDIYNRAKNWIARNLKSGDNMVNLDNADKSSIIATGNILMSDQAAALLSYKDVVINFKFSVYCKQGRFKVIIDNFLLDYKLYFKMDGTSKNITTSLEGGYKKSGVVKGEGATQRTYIEANASFRKMIADLKSSIESGAVPGDKDDW